MNPTPKIEFLISTMYRTNLSFLNPIFKNFDWESLNILIVNQTTRDKTLQSELENVRVINAFEKGLSRSRNLAISNSNADIAFIVDDDVEYLTDLFKIVKEAYKNFPDAALISFQYVRGNNKTFKRYKDKAGYQHDLLHKQVLTSMEISIRPKLINAKALKFNTCFGLGARFVCGEEQVLRDDIVKAGLKIAYVPKPIVKHYGKTSVPPENSKEYTQALVAQKYLLHHNLIYLWLLRYIWILIKRQVIKLSEVGIIWNYGITAVRDYKKIAVQQRQ